MDGTEHVRHALRPLGAGSLGQLLNLLRLHPSDVPGSHARIARLLSEPQRPIAEMDVQIIVMRLSALLPGVCAPLPTPASQPVAFPCLSTGEPLHHCLDCCRELTRKCVSRFTPLGSCAKTGAHRNAQVSGKQGGAQSEQAHLSRASVSPSKRLGLRGEIVRVRLALGSGSPCGAQRRWRLQAVAFSCAAFHTAPTDTATGSSRGRAA